MWKSMILLVCAVAMIGLLGCAEKQEQAAVTPVSPNAAKLWEQFGKDGVYTQYAFWPGKEGLMGGNSPHGAFIKTFVNKEALGPEGMTYPDGSLIIKENYAPDTTLAKFTVMYKSKGYNPEGGDWFWAVYGPDGTAEMEGKIQSCIGCHGVRKEQDYVFLNTLGVTSR
jgi:hypothetical protein